MFSRLHSKHKGHSKEQQNRRPPDHQASTLHDLGMLGPSSTSILSASGGSRRPDFDRSNHSYHNHSSVPARQYPATSYSERDSPIPNGHLGAQSHYSLVTPSSPSQSRESTMMNNNASRGRRERTFVGSECAVCEEPLEHTLQGERILQFSCTHVSHEACFYEFIREFESQFCPTCNAPLHLDTSRGGNVLDIEKISSMVRSVSVNDTRSPPAPTPAPAPAPAPSQQPWDDQLARAPSRASSARQDGGLAPHTMARVSQRDSRDAPSSSDHRYTPNSRHARSDSETTGATGGMASSGGYPETMQSGPPRRHDYDVQAMETSISSPPRAITRNPIPAPTVTIRSEFPTISKSRQQQTLTCLVTVEVPDNKWTPDPEDLQNGQPMLPPSRAEEPYPRAPSPARSVPRFYPHESPEVLAEMTENLRSRVDNWHGLDFSRFGKLRLYGTLRVGKDKVSWQELECFLFAEMLICVKEKKNVPSAPGQWEDEAARKTGRCTLKGSILIKKHLNGVSETGSVDENILTLSLSVNELPQFHLRFENRNQLKLWQQALLDLNAVETSPMRSPEYDREFSEADEDEWNRSAGSKQRVSSQASSWGGARSATTAPTEYTNVRSPGLLPSIHVPVDVVVVVPISASMQGVKINLVRDALRFMVSSLGDRDRMGLVTFGSSGGGVPVVGMTTKAWPGWSNVLASVKPVGQKSHRADVVEGANVAMDLLMGRKYNNPIATIMLISDASTSDADSVDFVASRAEAAKITIHSFGLGTTHRPDTMIELSTRTKASYTYVKDWMMLRECLAGCLGAMQSLSHQNVKLKLKLPEGSPAKLGKISGALQITKRATGRDAEANLGDLRFGDKRDVLVQLTIIPDTSSEEPQSHAYWDTVVSGLEAIGGPMDDEDQRAMSVEEVPLIQADLSWGDILREGATQHTRPSLLAITMLPATPGSKKHWTASPAIPPHPYIVQRRMEILTSDMLTRALTLVSRGQHDRAHTLLSETRSILKGLGKGGLPPVPPAPGGPPTKSLPSTPLRTHSPIPATPDRKNTPSPTMANHPMGLGGGFTISSRRSNDVLGAMNTGASAIDPTTVSALDAELESSLEWINHPAIFGRDSRKAVLQAIGVISSQRAFTFRTPIESLWAGRVSGIKKLTEKSQEWTVEGGGEGGIMEEA
ncbi:hypothetical protein QR685DRAFT_158426 [Neurospora intermedia]|uniref:von Willebrand and RING finger domain-containing protein n=1 Tax=Neurospora intermedia TaxID=5142 RepID=A0ABR3DJY0_NEUIN